MLKLDKIHHVAFRCKNAKETVEFYKNVMGMEFLMAHAEDRVPSTKELSPYMHVFLDAGGGNVLAFFELPNSPAMGRDQNTPEWVQHIAFQVQDENTQMEFKASAEKHGLDVLGPIDHGVFKSIYFLDPNGHRLEIARWTASPDKMAKLKGVAQAMLAEWDVTKSPPRHAAWVHEHELS